MSEWKLPTDKRPNPNYVPPASVKRPINKSIKEAENKKGVNNDE